MSSAKLLELKQRFLQGSADRVSSLSRALEQVRSDSPDAEAFDQLKRGLHGLAGLAGTHGFRQITEIARAAEVTLGSTFPAKAETCVQVATAIDQIRLEFTRTLTVQVAAADGKVSRGNVLVLEQDPRVSQKLARELGEEGFSVRAATTLAEALSLIDARVPDAIVTETILTDGSGFDLVEQVRATPAGRNTRAVILGSESNFLEKVQAIRCGADAFFEKQLDSVGVARRLRNLLDKPASSAQRILSVEDDPEQAEFLRAVLETGGYHVQVCTDPARFEQDLVAFRPDLVLMDILLPKVSGYDLARYIRQHEAYSTLPILFLTSDAQARAETMRAGGDDHLTKPISPGLLLTAVSQRLERANSVQRLIDRDGLTGLLTHSAFLERSKAVLSSCQRFDENRAALVMLDIDHFKGINDRYGHAVGDRLLATFAALLRRNVRNTDVVGRYGGDEFAFILNDLAQVDAERIVNRLGTEFSNLAQQAEDGTQFRATFSAGIAMARSAGSVEDWKKSADEAMYVAKNAGRNQVRAA